jgi:hypothetical protein
MPAAFVDEFPSLGGCRRFPLPVGEGPRVRDDSYVENMCGFIE